MRGTILALVFVGGAVPAMAQTPPDGPPPPPMRGGMFMRADANGDGVVTRAEAVAETEARFDRVDANRDGRLDGQEVADMRPRSDGPPRRPRQ